MKRELCRLASVILDELWAFFQISMEERSHKKQLQSASFPCSVLSILSAGYSESNYSFRSAQPVILRQQQKGRKLMSKVMSGHDVGEEKAVQLIRNLRKANSASARLLKAEELCQFLVEHPDLREIALRVFPFGNTLL